MNDNKDPQDSNQEEEYTLYTEKIVEKLTVKHKKFFRVMKMAGRGVVVGGVAAIVFMLIVLPWMEDRYSFGSEDGSRQPVNYPMDEYLQHTEGTALPEAESSAKEVESQEAVEVETTRSIAEEQSAEAQELSKKEPTEGPTAAEVLQGTDASLITDASSVVTSAMAQLNPSLVQIAAYEDVLDPFLQEISEDSISVPGVLIADNEVEYLILTDLREIQTENLKVTFWDGTIAEGTLAGTDELLGIAMVAVSHSDVQERTREGLAIVTMGNSYRVTMGSYLLSIGNFYGVSEAVDYGTVVSTSRMVNHVDSRQALIYTNINYTNDASGFLFNSDCELVGYISPEYSNPVGNVVAYGISDLKKRIQTISNGGSIARLGIIGQGVTENQSELYYMPIGLFVTEVVEGSGAYVAGILPGDVITEVNGYVINNAYALESAMCETQSGSTVTVVVSRMGAVGYVPIEFMVTLR